MPSLHVVACEFSAFFLHTKSTDAGEPDTLLLQNWCQESIVRECVNLPESVDLQVFRIISLTTGRMACRMAEHAWFVSLQGNTVHSDILLGQIAGISSTEFGLANMILAGVSIGKVGS